MPYGKTPEVGMLATYSIGGDCYPYVVVAMTPSGKTVTLRALNAIYVSGSGQDGSAEYRYEPYPEDAEVQEMVATYRRRRDCYCPKGSDCGFVHFGKARYYMDPSF